MNITTRISASVRKLLNAAVLRILLTVLAVAIGLAGNAQCTVYAVGGGGTFCGGGSATISLSGFDVGEEYALYKNSTTLISQLLPPVGWTWTVTQPGTYTIKVATGSCAGLDMDGYAIVTIESAPSVGLSNTPSGTTFCAGTTIEFSASGATSYSWTVNGNPFLDGIPKIEDAGAGTYNVSVTGTNACGNASTSTTITVTPQVSGSFHPAGPTLLCQNSSDSNFGVNLGSITGATSVGNWALTPSNAGTITGSGSSISVDWSSSFYGSVIVSATAYGCGGSYLGGGTTVSITQSRVTTLAGNNVTCTNQAYILTIDNPDISSSIVYTILKDGSPYHEFELPVVDYTWPATANGVYTLQSTATTCPGDQVLGSVTVDRGDGSAIDLVVSPIGSTFCEGDEIDFSASGGSGYEWTVNGDDVLEGLPDLNGLPGSYIVRVDGVNSCGIAKFSTANITIVDDVDAPPAVIGHTSTCAPSTTLNATADAPATFSWSVNPPNAVSGISASGASATLNWMSTFSGTATVEVIAQGCSDSTVKYHEILIKKPTELSITASPSGTVCQGSTVTLVASGGVGGYYWPSPTAGPGAFGSAHIISPSTTTMFTVYGTESSCGTSKAKTITVAVDAQSNGGIATSTLTDQKYNYVSTATYGTSVITGYAGTVLGWEYRLSSADWVPLSSSASATSPTTSFLSGYGSSVAFRAQVQSGVCPVATSTEVWYTWGIDENKNYVRIFTPQKPFVEEFDIDSLYADPSSVSVSTNYFDGATRSVQKVGHFQSPGNKDIVVHRQYDSAGREPIAFLPYATSVSQGLFKSNAATAQSAFYSTPPAAVVSDITPVSESIIERSALNRVIEQGAPGVAWQPGTNHTIRRQYLSNATDSIMFFRYNHTTGELSLVTGEEFYPSNTLACLKTIDESQHDVLEFLDLQNRTICKKVKAGDGIYASTYYVYDDFGNLVSVIQPEGAKQILNSLHP